ncbi:hypothetical protein AGMMS49957_05240 [Synergistales bacterium]|nr:hypothetical protein AGMMS49957_05240 [Synergistales bacterium]
MERKITIIAVAFCLFCAALIGGVYYVNLRLTELQGEYDVLQQRRVDLNQNTKALMEQKKVFSEVFAQLENYKVNPASNDMAFYDEVRIAAENNGVNILTTKQMGVAKDGRSSIVLSLRGDYYSFLRTLADWRNISTTVRVAALTITAPRVDNKSDARAIESVQADVTLEAIINAVAVAK